MAEIDLDAIRDRDATWRDAQPLRESAGRDRRALLQYIDELESLVEEIAIDINLVKRAHRNYQPKPIVPMSPEELDAAEREWRQDIAASRRKGEDSFPTSLAPGKVPP